MGVIHQRVKHQALQYIVYRNADAYDEFLNDLGAYFRKVYIGGILRYVG